MADMIVMSHTKELGTHCNLYANFILKFFIGKAEIVENCP